MGKKLEKIAKLKALLDEFPDGIIEAEPKKEEKTISENPFLEDDDPIQQELKAKTRLVFHPNIKENFSDQESKENFSVESQNDLEEDQTDNLLDDTIDNYPEKEESKEIAEIMNSNPSEIPEKGKRIPEIPDNIGLDENLDDVLTTLKEIADKTMDRDLSRFVDNLIKLITHDKSDLVSIIGQIDSILERILEHKHEALTIEDNAIKERENIKRELNILKFREEEIEDKEKRFRKNLQVMREQQGFIRGTSRIETIQILIDFIKDSIKVENQLEKDLEAEGYSIKKYPDYVRKIIRAFGDYSFIVEDAKLCQTNINQILKNLILLVDKFSLPYDLMRKFDMAVGLLTALHFRFDFIENKVDALDYRPLEFRRLFSALEPTIISLSFLDDEEQVIEDYDKAMKSFKSFTAEDKKKFLINTFDPEIIEKIDDVRQEESLSRLLRKVAITPEQVLLQISNWGKINKEYIDTLVGLLSEELTPKQKMKIAHKEIEELKGMNLIKSRE